MEAIDSLWKPLPVYGSHCQSMEAIDSLYTSHCQSMEAIDSLWKPLTVSIRAIDSLWELLTSLCEPGTKRHVALDGKQVGGSQALNTDSIKHVREGLIYAFPLFHSFLTCISFVSCPVLPSLAQSHSCLIRPVSLMPCPVSLVSCPVSLVSCPVSLVFCPVSPLSCPVSQVPCPILP
jgi:hypothetical protein